MAKARITIIGGGPIGLETAIYALELGYAVDLFEKGAIGEQLGRWGHVRLFSPWHMNHSPLGALLLKKHDPEWVEPKHDEILSGHSFVDRYLVPLSRLPQVSRCIRTDTQVISVGRQGILKGDLIGSRERTAHPFSLLLRSKHGNETRHFADIVIDATGVYDNPNWLGDGGIPAPGEFSCRDRIEYHLPDLLGADRGRFAGKRTLLAGAGYSAATTVCDFRKLIREVPETSLLWVTRGARQDPIPPIPDDPLAARAQLTKEANEAAHGIPGIEFRNRSHVEAIRHSENSDKFTVALYSGGDEQELSVDRVIANVGYGPDNSLYRELQVHECYASRGPMKLAAALLNASGSADCMEQTSMGPETLINPEPDFFIIGNKSYGRNPTFLLRIGLNQIVEVFSLLTGDRGLNLHEKDAIREEIIP